jgi:sugar phosphate isomerase/epimerase
MRLGGPVFNPLTDAASWVAEHRRLGYRAAVWKLAADDPRMGDFVQAARDADLLISEVGAWSNPISTDPVEASKAFDKCVTQLALADRVGARCCVNIAGSRGPEWDGPHPDNVSADTFGLIVEVTRKIIDVVMPTRTCFSLETMPWALPDSPDSYLDFIRAIDRKQFAVHLDPVNMINSPRRAYATGAFIRECFEKLGPHIRSCHAKETKFTQHLTVHLSECRPGTGILDYGEFLRQLSRLDVDIPLVLEHLPTPAKYNAAAAHLREVTKREGLSFE